MKLSRVSWETTSQCTPGGDLHGTHEDCVQAFLLLREARWVSWVSVTDAYGKITHDYNHRYLSTEQST